MVTIKILTLVASLSLVKAGLVQHGQSAYSTVQQHPTAAIAAAPLLAAPAVAAAPVVAAAAHTVAAPVVQTRIEPYDPNPRYNYAYAVNDQHTGDSKSQHETRSGDVVHGQYSLIDPDGSRRTVDYSAGPHTGFNAVVQRTPGAHPVQVAAAVAAAPLQIH